ncbi:putative odorant receptor 98b [Diachasma alloeum]|uniref:Odorant receptor n=1 Tax=Diachasma alloeum TaxID=454923 RepID=A0A4E0S4D9_9HYME|nr:putative odorant receptor 98b [Diachasma alloeum]THK32873.1 odorant receptor 181 [Diachasma alloeum]
MSKKEQIFEYTAFRLTTKFLLYSIGLWPVKEPGLFYRFLPFLCFFSSCFASLAVLRFIYHYITRINVTLRGMTIGTSLMLSMLKISSIMINRKRGLELHHTLEEYFSAALSDERFAQRVLVGITTVRRLCWVLIPTIFITVGGYVMRPITSIMVQKRNHVEHVEYTLIYPGLYPWNVPDGFFYQVHFFFEIIASITVWCVTCGMDALFAYYVFQIIGQLRVMSYRLTHVEDQKDMDVIIKECTQQYAELLKCRDSLQDIFGPVILWMMGTTAIVLCALIYQLSSQLKDLSIGRWIWILAYLIPKVTQAYIYGWCGSYLHSESEKYRSAIYHTNWLVAKKNTMSSIVIMLSQRPINLVVYKFFYLTVNMFLMILKTTLSYYFLLRHIEQKS